MNIADFNADFDKMVERSKAVLCKKAEEYATEDRLHNFKVAATMTGTTPEAALGGFMAKHTVSIYDMLRGTTEGKSYPMEVWDEKILDHMNYLLLLHALLEEKANTPTWEDKHLTPLARKILSGERIASDD